MTFSERQGLVPKKVLQTDSMDLALRNRLWNVLLTHSLEYTEGAFSWGHTNIQLRDFCKTLWHDHLGRAIDTLPRWPEHAVKQIREYFFSCKWNNVYDLVEFVAGHSGIYKLSLEIGCNKVLESELSAYRFVAGRIAPISSEQENRTIEDAIAQTADPYPTASHHLQQAIDLLAKKPEPDYRNSIKESISAVEALCAVITGKPKATLSDALKVIDDHAPLHKALRDAFIKLYGYTSDADGIRHALLQEPQLQQEDAIFMLAACSAFISYVAAMRARFKA
jgi:hypothetical protein